MRKKFVFWVVFSLLPISALAQTSGWSHPDELTFAPLDWKIPDAERYELSNGMVVYLQADAELPLFNAYAIVKTGSIYEPADKLGLAAVTGEVMRSGGTDASGRPMTGDEIDEELEFRAGSVETSIGWESGEASVKVLRKDADYGLRLLRDILAYPVFDKGKIELSKNRMIEEIRRQNDHSRRVAAREWNKVVYGKESPWARTPTVVTVSNIEREDVVAFHRKYFHPNNVILTVYGDFDVSEMKRKLEKIFGGWEREEVRFPRTAPIEVQFEPGIYSVEKEVAQSTILMGHYGIRRHDPETFKVMVMNEILGGGFTSRMTKEVRSNRGLS
ncbi:MAG: insulinase family protein, partial [candidate division Zixibacteria bacterium]|nr:insulinase family protein [candidate division Zixibacteria bacterium]